jgi:hypothetical protein
MFERFDRNLAITFKNEKSNTHNFKSIAMNPQQMYRKAKAHKWPM